MRDRGGWVRALISNLIALSRTRRRGGGAPVLHCPGAVKAVREKGVDEVASKHLSRAAVKRDGRFRRVARSRRPPPASMEKL